MTKPALVAFIMENTTEYKKTHLMEKHKAELEIIAAAFQPLGNSEDGTSAESSLPNALAKAVEKVYEDNKKLVKGRRLDKDEFKTTVIEKVMDLLSSDTPAYPSAVSDITISTMEQLIAEPATFCPINDNERKMLESIPLVPGYKGIESTVGGKEFLQKVKELHNIEIATSRALMVSLKRKKFISIGGGKNGGGAKTSITLLERGIRLLNIA